jgi:sec-independent protein translocase protein TatA
MGSFSIWHWIILGVIVLVVFGGKGKISDLMGDVAKGIKSFKKGMQDDDEPAKPVAPGEPMRTIDHQAQAHQTKVEAKPEDVRKAV